MRLLVIGETGQLARELARPAPDASFAGRRRFDLATDDPGPLLDADRPEAVVNAAAYTHVDRAESERDGAYALNRDGPARLAVACAARGIGLVHVSTDYVFDGGKGAPYVEADARAPLNLYGRSKAEGEDAVLAAGGRAAVVRVAWVFGAEGSTFVHAVLRLARERDELAMVADQLGRPTWGRDAAAACLLLAERGATGLWHAAGAEDATRADMAEAILAASARHGGPTARVRRITTAEYPTPAVRPLDSRLDSTRMQALGWRPTPWREAVEQTVAAILG